MLCQLWKMNDDFILMELQQSSLKAGITYTYQTTDRSGWGPWRIEQHLLLFPFKKESEMETTLISIDGFSFQGPGLDSPSRSSF